MISKNWIIISIDTKMSIRNSKGEQLKFSSEEVAYEIASQIVEGDFILFNLVNS